MNLEEVFAEPGRLGALAEAAMEAVKVDQCEAVVLVTRTDLTRFAESVIHQSISKVEPLVNVRVVSGKRIGCASGNLLRAEGAREVATRAAAIAAVQAENPDFVSLPGPEPLAEVQGWAEDTVECTAEARARAAKVMVEIAGGAGLKAAGAIATETTCVLVANSLGVRCEDRLTSAKAHVVVSGASSSGYAEGAAVSFGALDFREMGGRATEKALLAANPRQVEPGEYRVILEAPAVADMVVFLSYFGFGALAYQEGRSFLCENEGKRVAAEAVTLWDDGTDPRGLPRRFDLEGVPKRKMVLIERGIAQGPVYDSFTAHRVGRKSTGHGSLAPNPSGPYVENVYLAPGAESLERMVAGTEGGVLITRFHYTNIVHPKRLTLTGMTRDGTFLIEEGRLVSGLRNLRFDQGILEALAQVSAVSAETWLCESGALVPAVRTESFRFASGTEF